MYTRIRTHGPDWLNHLIVWWPVPRNGRDENVHGSNLLVSNFYFKH